MSNSSDINSFKDQLEVRMMQPDQLQNENQLKKFVQYSIIQQINQTREQSNQSRLIHDEMCSSAGEQIQGNPQNLDGWMKEKGVCGQKGHLVVLEQPGVQAGARIDESVRNYESLLQTADPQSAQALMAPNFTHLGIGVHRSPQFRLVIILFHKPIQVTQIALKDGVQVTGKLLTDGSQKLYWATVRETDPSKIKLSVAGPNRIQISSSNEFQIKLPKMTLAYKTSTTKYVDFYFTNQQLDNSGKDIQQAVFEQLANSGQVQLVESIRFTGLWEASLLFELRPLEESQRIIDDYESQTGRIDVSMGPNRNRRPLNRVAGTPAIRRNTLTSISEERENAFGTRTNRTPSPGGHPNAFSCNQINAPNASPVQPGFGQQTQGFSAAPQQSGFNSSSGFGNQGTYGQPNNSGGFNNPNPFGNQQGAPSTTPGGFGPPSSCNGFQAQSTPQQGYGAPQQTPGFGMPPQQTNGFGGPPQPYGAPPQTNGFSAQPAAPGFGMTPNQPNPQYGGYGAPQQWQFPNTQPMQNMMPSGPFGVSNPAAPFGVAPSGFNMPIVTQVPITTQALLVPQQIVVQNQDTATVVENQSSSAGTREPDPPQQSLEIEAKHAIHNIDWLPLPITDSLYYEACSIFSLSETNEEAQRALFGSKEYCDVTLRLGNQDIKAHRNILYSSSQYFRDLLNRQRDNRIGNLARLQLPNWFTEAGFKVVHEYMYGARVDLMALGYSSAKEALRISDFLEVDKLTKAIIVFGVIPRLESRNVIDAIKIQRHSEKNANMDEAWQYLIACCAEVAGKQGGHIIRNGKDEIKNLNPSLLFHIFEKCSSYISNDEDINALVQLLLSDQVNYAIADQVDLIEKMSQIYMSGYTSYPHDIRVVDESKPTTDFKLTQGDRPAPVNYDLGIDPAEARYKTVARRQAPEPFPAILESVLKVPRTGQLMITPDRSMISATDTRFVMTIPSLNKPRNIASELFSTKSRKWQLLVTIKNEFLSVFLWERGPSEGPEQQVIRESGLGTLRYTSVLAEFSVVDSKLKQVDMGRQPSVMFHCFPNGQYRCVGERNFIAVSSSENKALRLQVQIKEIPLHSLLVHYMSSHFDEVLEYKRLLKMNWFNMAYILSSDRLNVDKEEEAFNAIWKFTPGKTMTQSMIVLNEIRVQYLPTGTLFGLCRDHAILVRDTGFQALIQEEYNRRKRKLPITQPARIGYAAAATGRTLPDVESEFFEWLFRDNHHKGYNDKLEDYRERLRTQREEFEKQRSELTAAKNQVMMELEDYKRQNRQLGHAEPILTTQPYNQQSFGPQTAAPRVPAPQYPTPRAQIPAPQAPTSYTRGGPDPNYTRFYTPAEKGPAPQETSSGQCIIM